MIENPTYLSPRYGCDAQGRIRSWPLPFGPVAPEDLELAGWMQQSTPLPPLVEPGVLRDPMEVGSDG